MSWDWFNLRRRRWLRETLETINSGRQTFVAVTTEETYWFAYWAVKRGYLVWARVAGSAPKVTTPGHQNILNFWKRR